MTRIAFLILTENFIPLLLYRLAAYAVSEHWRQLSHAGAPGRPAAAKDLQDSIRWMSQTNPTWGALYMVGELRRLGLDVAISTVEKYRIRRGHCPQHRHNIYGTHFRQRVRNIGIEAVLIGPRSAWQKPYEEPLIGSIRYECPAHVIVLHEQHLR